MKRAIQRAKRAQLRHRRLRIYNRRWARWAVYAWQNPTPEQTLREKRHLLRNEGKPSPRLYPCGDIFCDWCISNKTYRSRREQERMTQERHEWLSGMDAALTISEQELQPVPQYGSRQKSASQLRRDRHHCPVCLACLPKNLQQTKIASQCSVCHAMPQTIYSCPRCGSHQIWKNRFDSACRSCGWHGYVKR